MIHLGYEIDTGKAVEIPLKHLAVIGQTQESGKTTTLEALIARSGLRAIAFVTKRGESSFSGGRRIAPYFRERADWQFVESVLESVMRQRMKFERAWIVRASKSAKTLADVQRNVARLMKDAKGLSADVYMLLNEYLDVVVPLLDDLPAAPQVDLQPGLNVMDLGDYPSQLQALVIRSVLEWIYDREQDTVTVVPEAWEFLPQGRGSPVKLAAATLIRKGAALRNYVWLDSQDLAGVEKEVLKQVAVWLIGVQREANELKRSLAHIPAGVKRPKPEQVATLGLGEFWACWQGEARRIYVQPAWMDSDIARRHARGERLKLPDRPITKEPSMSVEDKLDKLLDFMQRGQATQAALPASVQPRQASSAFDEEALYQRFKKRLQEEAPAILKLLMTRSEIDISVERQVIEVDGSSLRGRLAQLIHGAWFDEAKTGSAAFTELQRRGFSTAKPNVYKELDKLAEMGFVTKEDGGYKAVPEMKRNISKK